MSGVRVQIERLCRVHHKGTHRIEVLRDVDLVLDPGERVAIVGPSGSGKSTFLHALGLLDHPTSGRIHIDGRDTRLMGEQERAGVRNRRIGFVFQAHNLLPEHSALGNVMIPVRLAGGGVEVASARAKALLEAVGLGERLTHRPGELSGGEQQRVALARALAFKPQILLADEPTGNLDALHAWDILHLLLKINKLGTTVLLASHDEAIVNAVKRRVVTLDKGRVVRDQKTGTYAL